MRRHSGDEDLTPDMPPIESGQHLLGYLWEVGPVMGGGMAAYAITHTEIAAWCALCGLALQPWEARLLRRLSLAYVGESRRAEARDAKPPWGAEVDHKLVADSMRDSMRQLAE